MKKMKLKKVLLFLGILVVLLLFMTPFIILVLNTFKTTSEFTKTPFALPTTWNLDNYKVAIKKMNFWVSLKNTATITVVCTLLNTLVSSMT